MTDLKKPKNNMKETTDDQIVKFKNIQSDAFKGFQISKDNINTLANATTQSSPAQESILKSLGSSLKVMVATSPKGLPSQSSLFFY